jgi:hypothetical protein
MAGQEHIHTQPVQINEENSLREPNTYTAGANNEHTQLTNHKHTQLTNHKHTRSINSVFGQEYSRYSHKRCASKLVLAVKDAGKQSLLMHVSKSYGQPLPYRNHTAMPSRA